MSHVHEPEAAQLVAFVVLQVNCEAEPDCTLVGDAVSVTVGAPCCRHRDRRGYEID